jgi:hypothetical protein
MVKFKGHIGFVFILGALLIGCRTGRNEDRQGNVIFTGRPEQVLGGNFDLKIGLDSIIGKRNSYAFGLLDSLTGVFQVNDGKPLYGMLHGDSVVVNNRSARPAVVLVHCETTEWKKIALPASVANTEALVGFLEYNEALNLDTTTSFVFLIEGIVEQLDWCVIPEPLEESDPLKNDQSISQGNGTIMDKYIEIVGVYSTENNGGFTTKNIPVHMHFKTADGSFTGHVNHLELGTEMSLRIPVTY